MIDLINRVDKWVKDDIGAVQAVVNKYSDLLQKVLPEKNVPYVAVIIDICVDYLNGSHGATDADWKSWAVVVIKKLFEKNVLEKEADITEVIDEFLEFKGNEYEDYCKDRFSVNDFERDRVFVYRFIDKKIGNH